MTIQEQRRKKEEWKNKFRERIGRNLRHIRLKNDLTINELAKRTGISAYTIRSWEKYDYMPSVDDFFYVLSVTGWRTADIVMDSGEIHDDEYSRIRNKAVKLDA